jgi:hypothetical protein
MDVANEASAPEPEPAATIASSIDPAPAAASSDASATATAIALEDEVAAQALKRTPFRTMIARPFWAGMLGAGVGMWAVGAIQAFSRAHLISRPDAPIAAFAPVLLAFGVALARGYRAPVQSYASLLGRLLGVLFFGAICASVTTLILAAIFDGLHIRDLAAFVSLALAGALLAGLALARIHGVGADKSRRIKIASATAAALLVTIWPAAPSLRCRLGFGEGCREAADRQDDTRSAGLLAQRGCEHEDMVSCRLAGQAYQSEGPTRDLRRAEGFYREGCALGDAESCDGVHELELEQRCDRYGAFACAELARAHATGDGMKRDVALAQRYYHKACLLGADDACRSANGR